MFFELSDKLADQIIQALENQDEKFCISAKDSSVQPVLKVGKQNIDEENYYILPEWDSAKGFELRKDFVNNLKNPYAKDRLQEILHSGRGVFKSFKIEIKNYPEVEKAWHIFKNKKLRSYISVWYNELRELWGLEKLTQEIEETCDLINDDFIFQEYNPEKDKNIILNSASADFFMEKDEPETVYLAVQDLWQTQFLHADKNEQTGFTCRTLSNEFAGCITASPVSKRTESVVFLTSFFVPENYRGLGLGTQLLEKCLFKLKSLGKEWILLRFTIVPKNLEALLLRSGFRKTETGFSAKIQ